MRLMTRHVTTSFLVFSAAVWLFVTVPAAQQPGTAVSIDGDDIGGTVTSPAGPEAGVWVIAETTDLPTKFAKIVVTDDQGRYVLPDLPRARYRVWVRGYGLIDSQPVTGVVGTVLNLNAVPAPSPRDAARYYPANYWLSLMRVPPASTFPGTGTEPGGNGIPKNFATQQQWVGSAKGGCVLCHQIGNAATREIPKELGQFPNHFAAWDHRVQVGQAQPFMNNLVNGYGRQRTLSMFSDWTDRIAAGEFPQQPPPRPRGVERNAVVTLWDWGGPEKWGHVYDVVSTDRRTPTVNGNGKVYGTGYAEGRFYSLDPNTHLVETFVIPTIDPARNWPSTIGPMDPIKVPSPYWGTRQTLDSVATHDIGMDPKGRIWIDARTRDPQKMPAFCKDAPLKKFYDYFPINDIIRNLMVYDPATRQMVLIDTCFGAAYDKFAGDADNTLYFAGTPGAIGWFNTGVYDRENYARDAQYVAPNTKWTGAEAAQGWCPLVTDHNGDGRISQPWTEPNQPADPQRDRRPATNCYGLAVAPDGALWCSNTESIVRLVVGNNPPQSCVSEIYSPPANTAFTTRGLDVDSNGVVWTYWGGSGHVTSFDRRKCKASLNGPMADGRHCPEGWEVHEVPGPKLSGINATTDFSYMANTVERADTMGLGANMVWWGGSNSDSVMAFNPQTKEFLTFRVPYPMGMHEHGQEVRIDNPRGGWKGRGLWTNYGSLVNWHAEGSKEALPKLVKIQIRPNPLAK